MSHGASPDEGLGHLAHFDGRLDAGFDAVLLKGVLQGQGVDNGGEHAHVIAGGPVDAGAFPFHSAKDIAPAYYDDHLNA